MAPAATSLSTPLSVSALANELQTKAALSSPARPSFAFPKSQGLKLYANSADNSFLRRVSPLPQRARAVQKPGIVAMAGTGKFFVGGNWKCNGNKESIGKLVLELNSQEIVDGVDVVVSPPFVYLDQVIRTISDKYEVAAQNNWVGKGGAFTGEVSAEMLVDIGVEWVILGHSERRHILKESNEFVGKKEGYALSQNLKVIGCVGELLEEREEGKTFEVIFSQLQAMADNIPDWTNVVVAYEPVWAIGTGKVATPQQAQEVHAEIRKWLAENVSPEAASKTRIIYGGSVNASNSAELAKQEDIDGFLVGGASLKAADFAAIANSVTAKSSVSV